jgi:hypothetical protein
MSLKILKIQRPLESSMDPAPALVYDKSRTYQEFMKFSPVLELAMGSKLKIYVEAEVTSSGVKIIREVPAEDW